MKNTPFLERIDLSRHICEHMIGSKHTKTHRISVGLIIMVIGVEVAHSGIGCYWMISTVLDLGGYLIHGIGAIPILKEIEKHHQM